MRTVSSLPGDYLQGDLARFALTAHYHLNTLVVPAVPVSSSKR